MRCIVLTLLFSLCGSVLSVEAQPSSSGASDKQAVRATLDSLFNGMRAGDSTAVRSVFHEQARLQTAREAVDTSALRSTSVDAFVDAVGQDRETPWDERIWNVEIRVDGPLANAWVPYAFFVGDEFSHCGVNVVQLVRRSNRWKILQLTDTRRQDCDLPDAIKE